MTERHEAIHDTHAPPRAARRGPGSLALPLLALTLTPARGEVPEQSDAPKLEVGLSPAATPAITAATIDIDVEGLDLREVMDRIGRQAGRNVVVDPTVQESVCVSLRAIPWRQAVDVIARMTRCEVEERPGGVLVLAQPPEVTLQMTDASVRTVLQLLAAFSRKNLILGPDVVGTLTVDLKSMNWFSALQVVAESRALHLVRCRGDAIVVTARPLEPELLAALAPAAAAAAPGPRVWLEASGAALADVADQLGRLAGANVLVDPSVDEQVTLSLRGVAFREALELCARVTSCQLEERPGGALLFTRPPRGTLQAADCPAEPWLQMLSAASGGSAVIEGQLGVLTVDLENIECATAARLTAAALGFRCEGPAGGVLTFSRVRAPLAAGGDEQGGERPAPPRPRLGVTLEAESDGEGALVSRVAAGSPAERVGIRVGDRIVTLSGEPVKDGMDLRTRVGAATGTVELVVVRGEGGAREVLHVDPTSPARPEAIERVEDRVRVQAILCFEDRRAAVINGAVYAPGDSLREPESLEVVSIELGVVTLRHGAVEFTRELARTR